MNMYSYRNGYIVYIKCIQLTRSIIFVLVKYFLFSINKSTIWPLQIKQSTFLYLFTCNLFFGCKCILLLLHNIIIPTLVTSTYERQFLILVVFSVLVRSVRCLEVKPILYIIHLWFWGI